MVTPKLANSLPVRFPVYLRSRGWPWQGRAGEKSDFSAILWGVVEGELQDPIGYARWRRGQASKG
jgi:hypothetical protein